MNDDWRDWTLSDRKPTQGERIRANIEAWYTGPGIVKRVIRFVGTALQVAIAVVGLVVIGAFVIEVARENSPDRSGISRQAQEDQEDYEEYQRDMERSQYTETDKNEFRAEHDEGYTRFMEQEAKQSSLEGAYEEGQWAASDAIAIQDPGLVDCEEFETTEEATAFYEGAGGPAVDYFWLDEDQDGVACEALPSWDQVYESTGENN